MASSSFAQAPPGQPGSLIASLPPTTGVATSALPVTLTWTASTTPGVTYTVYRSTTPGFTPSSANQIISGVTSTTFEDYSASGESTYYYVVQAVSTDGTSNSSPTSATTGAIQVMSSDVIDINCGNATAIVTGTLTPGVNWVPDASAATTVPANPTAPGFTVSTGQTDQFGTIVVPAGLAGAAPAAVYQTFHAGVFTYTIFGLAPNTQYLVNLHLAEDWNGNTAPGQRVYNILVNGVTVFPNYDAIAASGGFYLANVQAVVAQSDNNGTITVGETAVNGTPLLAGIEVGYGVAPGNPTGTNPPMQPTGFTATAISAIQVNLNWTASVTPGVTYSVYRSTTSGFTPTSATLVVGASGLTGTSFIDTTASPSTTYYYLVQAVYSDGTVNSTQAMAVTGVIAQDVFNINAGTGDPGDTGAVTTAVPGVLGVNWLPDANELTTAPTNPLGLTSIGFTFSGGDWEDYGQIKASIPAGTASAAPLEVYNSAHANPGTYTIYGLIPSQSYEVALHFVEDYFTTAGGRFFNVFINSSQVLTNYDIVGTTGGKYIANVQAFPTTADTNGEISIQFVGVPNGNNPLISGIEIGTAATIVVPPPPPTAPNAPTDLTANPVSTTEIDLSWTASSTSGVTYNVLRGATQVATGLSSTTTTYADTNLTAGTAYTYTVQAVLSGQTATSNQASATTLTVAPQAPAAPTNLLATTNSATEIDLSWNASATTGAQYLVFRGTTSGFTPASGNQVTTTAISGTSYSDTGLAASTTYYYVVQAVLSGQTSASSNQASATTSSSSNPVQAITQDVLDINAGGGLVSGTLGADWAADEYATGGAVSNTVSAIDVSKVTNPAPQSVYQSNRFGNTTYAIPGFTAGASYIVNLHFAETYTGDFGVGDRLFNVSINGTPVLTNFDIYAAAGNAGNTAVMKSFSATADANGTITIVFTTVKDNAQINGIEIGTDLPPGNPTGPNPPTQPSGLTATAISGGQVNLSWNASSTPNVTYSVFRSTVKGFTPTNTTPLAGATGLTGTTYVDATVSGSTTYYYIVQALASDGVSTVNSNQASVSTPFNNGVITNTIIAIDAGLDAAFVLPYGIPSTPFTDVQSGFTWQQDTTNSALNVTFSGTSAAAADVVGITLPSGVTDSSIEFVLQTNRTGASQWVFGGFTAGQTYIVNLYFEESYFTTPNQRVFNVTLNGVPALTNFDIAALTGGAHIGTLQSFAVAADPSGNITVATVNVINAALISGIQIGTGIVGTVPAPPASLTATAATDSEIDLSWTASTTANVTYNVYSSTTSGFTPGASNLLQAGVTGTTYKNTGLANYTTYYYSVDAINANGGNPINSGFASASATTLPPPCTTLPTVPATVVATAASDTEIDLTWAASTAPIGCDITYTIYRGLTSGAESTTPINSASTDYNAAYSDTGLTATTPYFYYVVATDEAGSAVHSSEATTSTLTANSSVWALAWGDDFTGTPGTVTTYDHSKWWNEVKENTGNTWGDNTIQSTSDSIDNVYLDGNGNLVEAMTYNAKPGAGETAYTTARLHSIENIGYGKIEARVQNPSAVGMGAAFWALGTNTFNFSNGTTSDPISTTNPPTAGTVPWPNCGELDMMELQASGASHNGSTIHGYETDGGTNYEYGGLSVGMDLPADEPNFDNAFHTITTLWGPYHVQYFMDGVKYGDVNLASMGATDVWPLMGPSDNYTLNLIISSGTGGNGGTPGTQGFPSNYTFDYVHYSTYAAGVPNPVTNLTTTQVFSNAVQLNWTASTTPDVTYNVYAYPSTMQNPVLDLSTLVVQNFTGTSYQASGLKPGTTYHFVVLASNWGGESTGTPVTATTSQIGNSTGLQLSAGGYAVGNYISSQYVTGGNTNYHLNNVVDVSAVPNPAPQGVYDTERWGAATWSIANLNPNANYTVRLHFVEAAKTAALQRLFGVSINSVNVLNNFDIFATAGGANKAIVEQFTTQADATGTITIQNIVGTADQPTISAIEIISNVNATPDAPTGLNATAVSQTEVDLTWTPSTTTGATYTVYRSTTSGFAPSSTNAIGTATNPAFNDTTAVVSTTYYYVVEAVVNSVSSAGSNQATATTPGLTTQTINFAPAVTSYPYSLNGTFAVSATATSSLAVSFASTTPTICSVQGTTVSILSGGTCTVQATQAGNGSYSAALPVSVNFTIQTDGQTINFSSTNSALFASGTTYGSAPITLAAVGGGSNNPVVFTVVSGPGSISINILTITGAGTIKIAANQAGNADYAPADQVTGNLLVKPALPKATLAINPTAAFLNNAVGFVATVSSSISTPSGTVTFFDGTTPLGQAPLANGVATFSISSLTAGSHSITASYSGDNNFVAVTSTPGSELIEDFTLTASSSAQSIKGGSTATYTLTVAPPTGDTFPGAITLTVAGLPAAASYTLTPSTPLAAGSGSTTVTLTVSVPNTTSRMRTEGTDFGRKLAPLALGLLLLPFAGRFRRVSKRLNRSLSLLLLLGLTLAAAAGLSGCGSSAAVSSSPHAYTLTVTGQSGALSHSTNLTLDVQ